MKPSIVLATKGPLRPAQKAILEEWHQQRRTDWATQPFRNSGRKSDTFLSRFPKVGPNISFLLALAVILQPILYWFGFLSVGTLWVSAGTLLFIEAIFAAIFRDRVKATLEPLDSLSIELPTMSELLKIIEQEKFRSAKLKSSRLRRSDFMRSVQYPCYR